MQKYLINLLPMILAVSLTVFLAERWWERLNQPTALCPGCNVIIIDIDTFRADSFDCKGKPGDSGYPTNLCEFVKDAFKFENNFSQSHWTLPSAVSTHTGLYPPQHGVEYFGDILSENSRILLAPEVLRTNSYFTALYSYEEENFISSVTKTNRGYSSIVKLEDGESWRKEVSKLNASNRKFYTFFYSAALHSPYKLNDRNPLVLNGSLQSVFPITQGEIDRYINNELTTGFQKIFSDNSERSLEGTLVDFFYSLRNDENKASIYLKDDNSKTRDRPTDKWWDIYFAMIHSMYLNKIKSSPDAAIDLLKIYNAKVQEVDNDMGLFLKDLKESEFFNNTVFVFMSDHGEAFYEHGVLEHGYSLSSQYNELIHVPLYIYVPGVKGRTIKSATQNIDIFPTIFELIGINDASYSSQSNGKSLISLMKWSDILDKIGEYYAISFSDSLVSVQNKEWKMILNLCDEERLEIYSLISDPYEKFNVVNASKSISNKLWKTLEEETGIGPQNIGISWSEQFANRKSSCLK